MCKNSQGLSNKAVSYMRCNINLMPDNSTVTCRASQRSWQDRAEEAGVVPGPQHPSGDGWGEWIERAQRRSGCSHSLEVSLQADEHHSKREKRASEGVEKGENQRWKGWQWCTAAEQDTEGFSIQWRALTLSWKTVTEKNELLVDWQLSQIYNCSNSTKNNQTPPLFIHITLSICTPG